MTATVYRREVFTIPATESLSNARRLPRLSLVEVDMPAEWTAADITLQTAEDNGGEPGVWRDLWEWTGEEVAIVVGPGRAVACDPRALTVAEWVRARSGRSAAPVPQSAPRDIVLTFRDFG